MTTEHSHRFRLWLAVIGLAGVVLFFHQQIIGNVAYAVEKGKLEAGREHLAQIEKLEAISDAFREVAKLVRPAVVRIETTTERQPAPRERRRSADRGRDVPPRFEDIPEPFREFFKEREGDGRLPEPDLPPLEGTGSGVIIDADAGYIITNNHVVADAADNDGNIRVLLPDERRVPAKVVGRDPETELALLQIKADRLHALPLGDSEKVEVGDWVLAIGTPFGLDQSVTQGIISAKGRSGVLDIGYQDFLQTDAAINPGNSGGPLVNMRAEVIGINTAIATSGLMRGYMGVGFAIPSNTIKEVLSDLKEGREVVRGYLGVSIRGLDTFPPGIGKSYGLEEDVGVLVEEVKSDTPAAKAGLKMDDIILKYDGKRVESARQLQALVARTKPETKADMLVWRDKKEITIPITIEKQPKNYFAWGRDRSRGAAGPDEEEGAGTAIDAVGMTVEPLTTELAKQFGWQDEDEVKNLLVVTQVEPLGEARALGIRPGDLVISVQGTEVKTGRELRQALSKEALAAGVRVKVRTTRYGYRTFFLQLQAP